MPSKGFLSLSLIYVCVPGDAAQDVVSFVARALYQLKSSAAEMLLRESVNGLYCCRSSFVPRYRTGIFPF